MKKIPLIVLIVLIFLGFLIRVNGVTENPSGFFCDEASNGYNAYSILTTGEDEHGQSFPLFFTAFGEYKSPVFIYLDVPLVALFGLSEFSVRFLSVILGTATILFLYLSAKEMFGEKIALVSSFLLTISAWHIHYSRIGFKLISFPLFFSIATYTFFLSLRKKSKKLLFLSSVLFGVTVYTYGPPRFIIPAIFVATLVLFRGKLFKPKLLTGAIFALIFFAMFAPAVNYILGEHGATADPRVQAFFTPNPITEKWYKVSTGYINHFSPKYLFLISPVDFPDHFVTRDLPRGVSMVYPVLLPFFYIGLFLIFKRAWKNDLNYQFLLVALLLYPLGGTLTEYGVSSTRDIFGVTLIQMVIAVGLVVSFGFLKKTVKKLKVGKILMKTVQIGFVGAVLISFVNYYFLVLPEYRFTSADFWGWQYGPKEIMSYFVENQDAYDEMYMSGEFNAPNIFPPFYTQGKCRKCMIGGFENYNAKRKQLFALSNNLLESYELGDKFVMKKRILYPNGNPAFVVGEVFGIDTKDFSLDEFN